MEPTLLDLKVRQEARIVRFEETLQPEFCHRLQELGFCEGMLVRCVRETPFGGPKIFEVSGSIFSIEHDVARKVHVECAL
jgi:ferrous iron transport protein A